MGLATADASLGSHYTVLGGLRNGSSILAEGGNTDRVGRATPVRPGEHRTDRPTVRASGGVGCRRTDLGVRIREGELPGHCSLSDRTPRLLQERTGSCPADHKQSPELAEAATQDDLW